ncbi:MAG: MarR family transcriptional regulator [Candidatus Bathyarchaeota archaeon]|nr:MarR family transcriptional regulator [Candidatus Bathyarchaeota archaeon]
MRKKRLPVSLSIGVLLLLLIPLQGVHCQNYYVYQVQINSDGSANWNIIQFSSANTPVDTWQGFQEKIFNIVNSAASLTQRQMEINEHSLQINSTISAESRITDYSFIWQNFSIIEGKEIVFGDVFEVHDFFGQLYGDAAFELTYPSDYSVKSVTPAPYERQDSSCTLKWSRTQDLVNAKVCIVLISDSQKEDINLQYSLITVSILALVFTVTLVGTYAFKRRRTNGNHNQDTAAPALESEEDKIINLLRAQGGTMRQSEITERCRFSKAKASQLLSALETRGILTRYKKGRDKIVTLKEQGKVKKREK